VLGFYLRLNLIVGSESSWRSWIRG